MLHWSIFIIVQRDITQNSLFITLQVHCTCFGCQPHPLSGVHKTVTTASGTGHIFCAATSLQRGQASLVTLCTPADEFGWHPKHVEWTCRIINRLLCVAPRWTIMNIDYFTYLFLTYLGLLRYHLLWRYIYIYIYIKYRATLKTFQFVKCVVP